MTDSRPLLANHVKNRSETAFREIVGHYLNLVYSTALRRVDGDAHRAEDVAQIVFADLAKMASGLSPEVALGGWLHQHTCFVAANILRGERRRLTRERQAMEMNSLHDDSGLNFSRLAPVLDEVINELESPDRTAILLRFFEQQDFRSISDALESSEDAARMRVKRALGKLQELLQRRGIHTTAAALSIVITANAVQAAPAGLAVTISTAALAGASLSTATLAASTAKTVAMTTLQKAFVITLISGLAGVGLYQARQASALEARVGQLQDQLEPATQAATDLRRERTRLLSRDKLIELENGQLRANAAELLQLRGQVGRLRAENADLQQKAAQQEASLNALAATNKPTLHFDRQFLATAECTNRGLDTVDNALQTFLWAYTSGNEQALAEVSMTDEKGNVKKLTGLSVDFAERLRGVQPLSAGIVLSTPVNSAAEININDINLVHYSVFAEVEDDTDKGTSLIHMPLTLVFKKDGTQWKFAGQPYR